MPRTLFPYQNENLIKTRGNEADLIAMYEKTVRLGLPADNKADEDAKEAAEKECGDEDDSDSDTEEDAAAAEAAMGRLLR